MASTVPVKGLRELDAYLSALPANMQKNAYRQALTAAARPIRDEARVRAPKQTGKMARAIRTGSPRRNPDGTFSVSVSVSGNDHAFLAIFHEYGVSPHYISAGSASFGGVAASPRRLTAAVRREGESDVATGKLKIGAQLISGAVLHPGHGAQPFMRPALDIRAQEAVNAFANQIRVFIERKTGFTSPLSEAA